MKKNYLMNDFTKEELEDIYESLNGDDSVIRVDNCLLKKIQSMVDNYCEHEEKENIGGWVWKCVKCGMKFGDETQ